LECNESASDRSLAEATGQAHCGVNVGASAWFWFVAMTTIGYGNQIPTTTDGIALVGGLAWLGIVLFGAVSVFAGRIMSILLDDFFRRFKLTILGKESFGALFWCGVSIGWIYLMGLQTYDFWNDRIINSQFTRNEALWFSYVTSTTIGFGNLYLQPEVFFVADVFTWSLSFLIGFVFLTSFLGKVGDIGSKCFPDSSKQLLASLERTNFVGFQVHVRKFQDHNRELLTGIEDLVGKMHHVDTSKAIEVAQRKKALLERLMDQTDHELDYFSKQLDTPSITGDEEIHQETQQGIWNESSSSNIVVDTSNHIQSA
jgi:hypothetical protein